LTLTPEERPAAFDRLRKDYPVRREFAATTVLVDDADGALVNLLRGVGFNVLDDSASVT
jgi:hypothetical protein